MRPALRDADPGIHARRRAALVSGLGRPVLVFGMGSALGAGTRTHGALRYLTGWDGHESQTLLILTEDRPQLIVASPFMQPLAAETLPELAPVFLPPGDWPAFLRGVLPAAKTGLIGLEEVPQGLFRMLEPVVAQDVEASGLLDRMRLIKEPAALGLHQAGAGICDALFARLAQVLRPGCSAPEVQRDLECFALSQGADYCRTWLTVRAQADRPRYWPEETAGLVSVGDQVLMGVALTVDGHWAHGIRMGAIGPMRPDHLHLMETVSESLAAGLAMARPGVALADLADRMEAVLIRGAAGLDMRGAQRFRSGHGLGMSYEDPILTDAFVQSFGFADLPARAEGAGGILAPGMVLELHPNLFLPGVGGAALGEMVIITDEGAICPIQYPRAPMRF